jgi:hypothetical protein
MDSSSDLVPFLPWAGMLLASLCLWGAMRALRRRRLHDDTPTCKTTGVFIGLVELKGTAESEQPLVAYLSGIRCVHHAWSVEEHWSRTVTESYTDSKGKRRTRTRRESGWKTIASGGQTIAFYLRDDQGAIRVAPDGAQIEAMTTFEEHCTRAEPLYYEKAPPQAIAHSDHRRRFTETAIPLHAPLYVLGRARERQDIVAAEIAHDPEAPLFLISTRDEESIARGKATTCWLLSILAGILAVSGWIMPGLAATEQVQPLALLLALAGFGIAWTLAWTWTVYNCLLRLHQGVAQAWANVEVELMRRHDLIPSLVSIVTGLRDYESKAQAELAQLRRQLQATAPGRAGPDPEACAPRLVAIAEAYPELTASEAFLNLQEELARTEERLALARAYYNEIATFCNIRQQIIPDRYVAALAKLRPRPLMQASGFARARVEVTFAE